MIRTNGAGTLEADKKVLMCLVSGIEQSSIRYSLILGFDEGDEEHCLTPQPKISQ